LTAQNASHTQRVDSFCISVYFGDILCSRQSELFISVHVQRWTVLRLYKPHDWRINCWAAVRLYGC